MAFSSRDFRLIWGGQTISFVGDAAFIVALGWRVTDLTGKASSLGFVLALESLAMLLTLLWGGVLADRYSRRLLMIGSDLARVLCDRGVLRARGDRPREARGDPRARDVFGLADGFFQPAFAGIVPLVVEQPMLAVGELVARRRAERQRDRRARRSPRRSTTRPARRSSGGSRRCSFVVSAAALWLARPRAFTPGPRLGLRRELGEGLRYVPERAVDVDGDRRGDRDPDDRDGAVHRAAAARRAGPLRPRRRRVRRDLQRDGRGHGRRLARVGEVAPARRRG